MRSCLICAAVDQSFDAMLAKLGCSDGSDANLVSHWQDEIGYRLQATRKADGKSLTRLVRLDGSIA